MTKRLPSGPPCFDPTHGHVILARHVPLPSEEDHHRRGRRRDDGADLYVTVWLCPVRHELCVALEDESDVDVDRARGGPLDEL